MKHAHSSSNATAAIDPGPETPAAAELLQILMSVERDREFLRLQVDRLQRESERKTQELLSISLQLTQRNEAFKSLKDILAPYARRHDSGGELAARILREISSAVGGGRDWRVFAEQFEQIYHDFILALKQRAATLTPAELRICVLIKMNLSTKQIAELLFTSQPTVKSHRTSIRRKLGMTVADNLGSWLIAL